MSGPVIVPTNEKDISTPVADSTTESDSSPSASTPAATPVSTPASTPVSTSGKRESKRFAAEDIVFAKVRGYPPWPAKIQRITDEHSSKAKYHVLFYGTRETAVCKREEIFDYVQYRDKYDKSKRRFFAEALDEVERELDPSVRREDLLLTPLIGENNLQGATPVGKETSVKSESKGTKRKSSAISSDESAETQNGPANTSQRGANVVSRSGRTIKPKRFSDGTARLGKNPVFVGNGETNGISGNDIEGMLIRDENEVQQPEKKKMIGVHVKNGFMSVLKQRVQTMENNANTPREAVDILKIEIQLLDADCRIKSNLSLTRANCDECMRALDEIIDLRLTKLILKKHPEVVDTIKKLRRYVGNLEHWNMSPEQEVSFKEKAAKIRMKAENIFNKFKTLFSIPENDCFMDTYAKEIDDFSKKIVHLSYNEICGLTEEPDADPFENLRAAPPLAGVDQDLAVVPNVDPPQPDPQL